RRKGNRLYPCKVPARCASLGQAWLPGRWRWGCWARPAVEKRCAREQTFLSPAVINVGSITREDRAENKSKGRDGDEQRNLRWPGPAKQIGKRFEAASRWMFFSTPNASAFCRHRFCLSARRLENATGDCSADWSDG